jgi:hypothetical protein
MGRVQAGISTVIPDSGSQTQTEALGGWQTGDHRRHKEALGVT